MNKNILIISISILGIVALGAGIYFAWRSSKNNIFPALTSNNQAENINNLPAQNKSKLTIISKNDVLYYWAADLGSATSSARIVYYISRTGSIFLINNTGEEAVSNSEIKNISQIKASNDGKMVLIKSEDSIAPNISILNVATKVWQSPVWNPLSADWSPDSKKLAYLAENPKGASDLIIKDFGNSRQKEEKIISLHQKDFDLKWVEDNRILLVAKPSFDIISEIWEVNVKTKTISKMAYARGLLVNWSQFGDAGLEFSAKDDRTYNFSLIDGKGRTKADFKFKTFPDKCVITAPGQIYCAISRDQDTFSSNIVLPDDYLKRKIFFKDGIYQIDLKQNKFQTIYDRENPLIDAVNLKLDGNRLLFINRYDQKLYSLALQ